MPAFAVKHVAAQQGPLQAHLASVKHTPYSFTSRATEASAAAAGADVYVIEVRKTKAVTTYWLGYKYRAQERYTLAGGGKWQDRFAFKNSATPGEPPIGVYFDAFPRITDTGLCDWLSSHTLGMAELPEAQVRALEAMIAEPANQAAEY